VELFAQDDGMPIVVIFDAKSVVGAYRIRDMMRLGNAEAVNRAEVRRRQLAARSECQGERSYTDANEDHGPN
jgi:hypothetical protein